MLAGTLILSLMLSPGELRPLACAAGMCLLRPAGFLAAVLAAALASSLLIAALYDTGADLSLLQYVRN
jgi:hypothetical protein